MKRISVLIQNESDFDKIKTLTKTKLKWHENYLSRPTSMVIKDKKQTNFGVGSIGCSEYQKEYGFTIIDTNFNII